MNHTMALVILTEDEYNEMALNGKVILSEELITGNSLTKTTREFGLAITELTDDQILDRDDDTI